MRRLSNIGSILVVFSERERSAVNRGEQARDYNRDVGRYPDDRSADCRQSGERCALSNKLLSERLARGQSGSSPALDPRGARGVPLATQALASSGGPLDFRRERDALRRRVCIVSGRSAVRGNRRLLAHRGTRSGGNFDLLVRG